MFFLIKTGTRLESVIKNFKEFDDVVAEAQNELDKIKAEESKRNSSIQN